MSTKKTKAVKDEIELLTVLIEKYGHDHSEEFKMSPDELLKSLIGNTDAMTQNELA